MNVTVENLKKEDLPEKKLVGNVAYILQAPWSQPEFSKEATLEKRIKMAGLDWNAEFSTLHYFNSKGTALVPGKAALFRSDNGSFLGVVGENYKVVQPRQVIEFYGNLIENFGFEMEAAGSFSDGKRIWALANTKQSMDLNGDENKMYLLLATSFDGSMATHIRLTNIRVASESSLNVAVDQKISARDVIKVMHSQSFDADKVKRQLAIEERWLAFQKTAKKMIKFKLPEDKAIEYLSNVYDINEDVKGVRRTRFLNAMEFSLKEAPGADLPTAKGTLWGAVNAVSFDIDHRKRRNEATRAELAMIGYGNATKEKAWKLAERLMAA